MRPVRSKVCSLCGESVPSADAERDDGGLPRCPHCRRIERPYERFAAHGSPAGGIRERIHLLKYNADRRPANVLGPMLAETIAVLQSLFGKATLLEIPVPLYKGKRGQRGFDQAERIVRRALQLSPANERPPQANDVLLRVRDTRSQIGLTSHQRRHNKRGAFQGARATEVTGREVLLVDDVYTTGTTASECARVLRRTGASKVWVATVARTMKLASKRESLEQPAADEPGFKVSTLQDFKVNDELEVSAERNPETLKL